MILRAVTVAFSALVFLAGVAPPDAQADAVMHEVEFSEFLTTVPGEVMASFPERLVVHPGDTIHFSNDDGAIPETGIHLVSLLPEGMTPETMARDEFRSPEGAWATFITDPDEAPAEAPQAWKLNNLHFWPSDPYCGHTESNPCDFDGSDATLNGILNAGAGIGIDTWLDFYVRITADPGTTLWALCPWHPAIAIQIDVVEASEALPPAQQAADSIAARMPRYEAQAAALHKTYLNKHLSVKGPNGSRIWEAWPGLSRGPIFLADMYPKVLPIEKGDSVRWHFPANEIHTVTFPFETASSIVWLTFQCDLDTDSGPLPDTPSAELPPFCPAGPVQFEADMAHEFPYAIGDGQFTHATDFETSGVRSAGYPGLSTKPYALEFPSLSPTAGFTYSCLLHPTMRGTVVVGLD